MDNKNNQNQPNEADINTDALNESQAQTTVRPKMNLAPNSKHQASTTEAINPDNQAENQQQPVDTDSETTNQVEAPPKTEIEKEGTPLDADQGETPPPTVPLPEKTNGGMGGSQPPKTGSGMSDNMKYLLIGIVIVILIAGGIVAWNMFFNEGEPSAPAEEQQTEQPVDTEQESEEPVADTTAPNVNIATPSNNTTVSETFTIEGTIDDESSVESLVLYMNDSMAEEITNPNESFTIEIDSLNFANGTYTAYVVATDSEGNVGESSEVTVEIANTPPEPAEEDEPEDQTTNDDEPASLPKTGAGWR